MARPLKIAWRHTEEELYELYRREKDADLARRWQALWLLRRGERLIRVKAVVGVIHRTIQRWVRWYEAGGIAEVARPKSGSMKTHRQAWTAQQEAKLRQAVEEGRFRTAGEVVRWCAEALGIEVSEAKVYHWLRRWGYRKKVPWRSGRMCRPRRPGKRGALGGPSASGSEAGRGSAVCG